jgi:hypothetical protein
MRQAMIGTDIMNRLYRKALKEIESKLLFKDYVVTV